MWPSLRSCASTGQVPEQHTRAAIRARDQWFRVEGTPLRGCRIQDGLTSQEAVAIALWNSPSFQATLADLGIARADLVEAGLLRNPVFSLLFPVGPKQLEWTLQFPFDALWQRPRRVAAARLNAQAVAERLVWDALSLVAQTRTAHADALIADRRLQLTIENADLVQRLGGITEARLRSGDISELEARPARSDAARAQVMRRAVEHDRNLARLTLAAMLGLDTIPDELQPVPGPLADSSTCGTEPERLEEALASRPDVVRGIVLSRRARARGNVASVDVDRNPRRQRHGERGAMSSRSESLYPSFFGPGASPGRG